MRNLRSAIASVTSLWIVLALLPAPASAGVSVPCASQSGGTSTLGAPLPEVVQTPTLHIQAKVPRRSFRIGQKVPLSITVTRPSGAGTPLKRGAAGINVGVGVALGNAYLTGAGITNGQGKVVVGIKLKSYVKPGPASVRIHAYKDHLDTPCLRVEEEGFRRYSSMFSVKR